ncbi:probable protein phosphatase 2C 75 isoform X1 [Tripterygium wilfordii]|uniref:probable protein phosphatase 2C 75 isoform X1 n=1 Tax=Tripterygium wilfordii TaxID=458696 RepID=UPI0018F85807|nr:probable protein phosphatase 2C 75 isoform X1 [Tripterygium wilfordii]
MSDRDEDSPGKCRERRRRMLEMRRMSSQSISPPDTRERKGNIKESSGCVAKGKRIHTEEATGYQTISSVSAPSAGGVIVDPGENSVAEPVFGMMSVAGRSSEMEDAISIRTNLCRPEISLQQPVHFFAVYDGHGGSHVAALCRERMHLLMEEELVRLDCTWSRVSGDAGGFDSTKEKHELQRHGGNEGAEEFEEKWRRVMKRTFRRMDEAALSTCVCGSMGYRCGCHPMEVELAGSTAVVAVLTAEHILIANCGDSRAVLCRNGRAIPLSFDHKPDRSDELARIEAAGGQVIFLNGARVQGILAMSRAIGDKYLKPIVTSEPETTLTKRKPEDDCLILASDGLWDVLSSDLACEVACECLREGSAPANLSAGPRMEDEKSSALYPARSVLAAALLTRLALGRKSSDNISVIVVDLKRS